MISIILQKLNNLNLNTDYFFSLNISQGYASMLGDYNADLITYIEEKGFYQIDYLYKNNPNMIEYKNDLIYITLMK